MSVDQLFDNDYEDENDRPSGPFRSYDLVICSNCGLTFKPWRNELKVCPVCKAGDLE